jgi:hypothetical protein
VGAYDKGKVGRVVEDEKILVDRESGQEYVKVVGTTFYTGQGNWNRPNCKSKSQIIPNRLPEAN